MTLWILVANRGFAKIYEVKGHGRQIHEVQHIENPDGRKKSGEILSDRPGRAFDRMGGGRHAVGTQVDVCEHEQKMFASKLASILQEGKDRQAFEEVALIAPPQFLGDLKNSLKAGLKKVTIKEIAKDLPEDMSESERIDQVCKYLDLWNRAPT